MLNLQVDQHQWILLQERERLAVALDASLPTLWPNLSQQLGPRGPAFVRASLQAAWQHGFEAHRHAVRLFNLWCIWGPSFESKPGFEWANDVLTDEARPDAIKIQQLFLQTRVRLQQSPTRITVEQLDHSDSVLLALIAQGHAASWIKQAVPKDEPRVLCDFSAIEIELADQPWRHEYQIEASAAGDLVALRKPYAAPKQSYRVERAPLLPRPLSFATLAYPLLEGVRAMLHIRSDLDHVCHTQHHPRMAWSHDAGVDVTQGERVLRRPLYTPTAELQQRDAAVMGLAREPAPTFMDLRAETCGLRMAGAPIRQQDVSLAVWPADQWLCEIRNRPQADMAWPASESDAPAQAPDLMLAADGRVLPTEAWLRSWMQLVPMLRVGVDRWGRELERSAVLLRPRLTLMPGLMHGRSMWTWGMREAVSAEGSEAFLRVQAEGEWVACASDFILQSELQHDGALARLKLRSVGEARFSTKLACEQRESSLAQALGSVKVSWRHPFEAELEALSSPSLKTISLDGDKRLGALCGEAGLRARADGQGYEWYCQLRLEAAQISYTVWDALAGTQRCKRDLWPATLLLDWSAG